MVNALPSGLTSDREFYSAHFMDLNLWEPSVRLVCRQHGLRCKCIKPAVPGTFPTFIVDLEINQPLDKSVVVKFFGPLFDGGDSFRIEKEMGYWLDHQNLPVPSPSIIVEGQLDQDWTYLVFEKIEGVSIHQARQTLSAAAWRSVAKQMGTFMKELHMASSAFLLMTDLPGSIKEWSGFVEFLQRQRASCAAHHEQWGDLPFQLLPQVNDYLLPVENLIDLSSPPHLIHADLTGDHLLGRLVPEETHHLTGDGALQTAGAGWDTAAIIDWGDTRVGNILYELVALHLGSFQADVLLLSTCLKTYDLPDFYRTDFARKVFNMVLLHQFPMPATVYAPHEKVQTLDELARRLFEPQVM